MNMQTLFTVSYEIPGQFKNIIKNYQDYLEIEVGNSTLTVAYKVKTVNLFIKRTNIHTFFQIDSELVREFFYTQTKEKLWSKNTYRAYYTYLRCFCKWAIFNGHLELTENPVEKLEKPKKPSLQSRRLSKEELNRLVSCCCTYPWGYRIARARNTAIIVTFICTGIRHDELLSLRVEDISFTANTVFVRNGKGGKPRILKMPLYMKRYLEDYEDHIRRLSIQREYFFCTVGRNMRMTNRDIYHIRDKLSKGTGIHFVPHQLRHSFASIAAEENIHPKAIAYAMGHESTKYTERYINMEQLRCISFFDDFNPL